MAHCDEYLELISASLDGALSLAQQEKLNAHLASCAECQKLYDDLSALHAALMDLPPVEVPAGLKDRIMDAVAAEAENTKVLPFAPKKASRHWQRWLASAAVLAVVVMGTWSWKPWEVHEPQANSPRSNEVAADRGMDSASFTVTGASGAADGAVPAAPASQPSSLPAPAAAPEETAPAAMPKLASAPLDAAAPTADPTAESADAPAEKNAVRSGSPDWSWDSNGGAAAQGFGASAPTAVPAESGAAPSDDETAYGSASVGQALEVSAAESAPAVQSVPTESGDTISPQSAVMPRLFSAPVPQSVPSPAMEKVPEQGVISRADAVNALVSRFYDGQVEHVEVTEEEPGVRYAVGISSDAYWLGGASGVIVYVGEDEEVYLFDAKNDFSDHWIHLSVNKQTSEITELEQEELSDPPMEEIAP